MLQLEFCKEQKYQYPPVPAAQFRTIVEQGVGRRVYSKLES